MKVFKVLSMASLFSYVVVFILLKMGFGNTPKRECSDTERKTLSAESLKNCLPPLKKRKN
ncbi:MAG: hypothetical protein ACRBBP_07855 [Bdellovibrionales bacterium]